MTPTAARELAERLLDDRVRGSVDQPVEIVDEATEESDEAFAFFYNTSVYLETGSVGDALAGNGPVVVDKATGEARLAGSHRPRHEQ